MFQKGNEGNVLSFDDMEFNAEGYVARIDADHIGQANPFSKNFFEIPIDHLVKLDPERMAKKYGISVTNLPVTDDLLTYNRENLILRVMGGLPKMKIYNCEFIIDLRLGLLRPVNDFRTIGIELKELPMDPSGSVYQCFYDFKKHELAQLPLRPTSIPKNVIAIEIPNENALDPFYCAMKYSDLNGLSRQYPIINAELANAIDWEKSGMSAYFNRYPVRYNLEARVVPWESTGLLEVLKENQKVQNKNRSRKAKGKGL